MEIDRIHSIIQSYMNDNLSSAIEECNQILEKNGSSILGRLYRGFSYLKKGLYNEAIEDFNEAEKLQAGLYDIHLNRAKAYYNLEKFKEASSDIELAIQVPKISQEQKKIAEDWQAKIKSI